MKRKFVGTVVCRVIELYSDGFVDVEDLDAREPWGIGSFLSDLLEVEFMDKKVRITVELLEEDSESKIVE